MKSELIHVELLHAMLIPYRSNIGWIPNYNKVGHANLNSSFLCKNHVGRDLFKNDFYKFDQKLADCTKLVILSKLSFSDANNEAPHGYAGLKFNSLDFMYT